MKLTIMLVSVKVKNVQLTYTPPQISGKVLKSVRYCCVLITMVCILLSATLLFVCLCYVKQLGFTLSSLF